MASMALLNPARGETKGRSEEERVGEAGEGWGETGTEPGEEGEQDELERRTRGENINESAPSKPCFLQRARQLEELRMRAAVPQASGARDAEHRPPQPSREEPAPPSASHGN